MTLTELGALQERKREEKAVALMGPRDVWVVKWARGTKIYRYPPIPVERPATREEHRWQRKMNRWAKRWVKDIMYGSAKQKGETFTGLAGRYGPSPAVEALEATRLERR